MSEFTAPSGAKIVINVAPWKDAKALQRAIGTELSKSLTTDSTIAAFLSVASSEPVDAALQPCLARCLRNGQKIVESTFDDPATREDYLEVVEACIKENLGPLFESLFSKFAKLAELKKQAADGQK